MALLVAAAAKDVLVGVADLGSRVLESLLASQELHGVVHDVPGLQNLVVLHSVHHSIVDLVADVQVGFVELSVEVNVEVALLELDEGKTESVAKALVNLLLRLVEGFVSLRRVVGFELFEFLSHRGLAIEDEELFPRSPTLETIR